MSALRQAVSITGSPSYQVGDVIFRSQPWIYSVLEASANTVCYRCFKKPGPDAEKVRRCTQCLFAHYCSVDCQKNDWPERHKFECKVLAQVVLARKSAGNESLPLDYFLIILKILAKLKKNDLTDAEGASFPPTNRNFFDLMSHAEELSGNPGVQEMYRHMKPYIAKVDKSSAICPDFSAFVGIYGRFQTNGFSIADYFEGDVGKGLYLGPSVLDHSCDYNAVQFFSGNTLVVKAIKSIHKLFDVRIAYDSTFDIRSVRQGHLFQQYFFTCSCTLCTDCDLEARRYAARCSNPTCDEGFKLDVTDHLCPKCHTDNSTQLISAKELVDRIVRDQEESKIPAHYAADPTRQRRLEEFAKNGVTYLHATNFALGLVCMELYRLLEEKGEKNRAIPYLKMALPSLRFHANKYESAVTGALSDLMHDAMDRRKFEEAYEYALDLMDRLKVIPGEESAVYQEYSRLRDDCELATWARMK